MRRDRLFRRALVPFAIVLASAIAGCSRMAVVRPPTPAANPAVAPIEPSAAMPASAPAAPASSLPPAGDVSSRAAGNQSAAAAAPVQANSGVEPRPFATTDQATPQTEPAPRRPAAVATPMLDAAIERVEAVRREELESADAPGPTGDPASPAAPASAAPTNMPAGPSETSPAATFTPTTPVAPARGVAAPESESFASPKELDDASDKELDDPSEPPQEMDPPVPSDLSHRSQPSIEPKHEPIPAQTPESEPEQPPATLPPSVPPAPPASPPRASPPSPVPGAGETDQPPFALSELRICAKVHGFGSIEPLDPAKLQAGQRVLLYCEVGGIAYEPLDDLVRSRLSSRIEIQGANNGPILWSYDLGSAEDVCRRRRRDYFVNYVLELPRGLAPGRYQVRLSQTDLVSSRSTSAELAIQIIP